MVVSSIEILGILVSVSIVDGSVRSLFRLVLVFIPFAYFSSTCAAGNLYVAVTCCPARTVSAAVVLILRGYLAEDDTGIGTSCNDAALEMSYETARTASRMREDVSVVRAGFHGDVRSLGTADDAAHSLGIGITFMVEIVVFEQSVVDALADSHLVAGLFRSVD